MRTILKQVVEKGSHWMIDLDLTYGYLKKIKGNLAEKVI